MLAEGWEITDFAKPWPRGPVPVEALVVELIVGLLDSERRQGSGMSADDFHAQAEQYIAARREAGEQVPDLPRRFTDDELQRVRAVRADLLTRWTAVLAGEALELEFAQ